ncbi:hypothetical protein KJ665_01890 [Patescibacteria group bacterium]|nr:hypothetical protein [Patescibacteria group bacterium]
MDNLDKTKDLIDKFIKVFKDKHPQDDIEIEGIFLTGSFLNSKKISKNSDLDLFLVIKNIGKRFRGVFHVDGVEIDYFINPFEQFVDDFEKAKKAPKKTMVHILAGAQILQDKDNGLERLKNQAQEFLGQEVAGMIPDFAMTMNRYFVNDYLKDIEDCYEDKDVFAWQYNESLILNYLIEIFCQQKSILLVKPKYQKEEIAKKDDRFVELYEKVAQASFGKEKNEQIKKLAEYVIENLGGQLPEDWEIVSGISVG